MTSRFLTLDDAQLPQCVHRISAPDPTEAIIAPRQPMCNILFIQIHSGTDNGIIIRGNFDGSRWDYVQCPIPLATSYSTTKFQSMPYTAAPVRLACFFWPCFCLITAFTLTQIHFRSVRWFRSPHAWSPLCRRVKCWSSLGIFIFIFIIIIETPSNTLVP